jgi:hypothetical protein
MNGFTLWKTSAVRVTKGQQHLGTYSKTPRSLRQFCTKCGGHVMTAHPHWDLIDVYAAVIPDFPFQPAVHVNYAEAVVPIKDGLPKLKDLPKELGGTGESMAE